MGTLPVPTVFVWHPGSLGDVLLARPAIRALRATYPRHALLLAAQEEIGRLLRNCGEIDGLFSIGHPALADLCAGSHRVQGVVGDALGRCEVAVCWLADQDGRVRQALEALGIPRVIVGSPHDTGVHAVHQADRFLEVLTPQEARSASWEPLHLPEPVVTEGRRRLGAVHRAQGEPCAVIHAGSGSPHKCCAPPLLAELITRLRDRRISPVLVVGPADGDLSARLQDLMPVALPTFQGLDLVGAAGLLAAADLYIGHDSGLTHLAAAVAMPTVALFGPTAVARWAPRGRAVAILSGPPCRCDGWLHIRACEEKPCLSIPVESVLATCHRLLQRRPQDQGVRVTRLP